MKTLYLLRHAKSSWHDPGLNDFDRPLNPRGLRNAPLIGTYMAQKGYLPDVILCSAARRTLETLSLIKPHIGLTVPTQVEDGLYLAPARTIIATLNEVDEAFGSALFIGHNPGLEDCMMILADSARARVPLPDAMPTAGLVAFQFDVSAWADVTDGSGELIDFATPKGVDDEAADD